MAYRITITINQSAIPEGESEDYFAHHRAWFKQEFDAGNFLLVGPLPSKPGSGCIVAQAENRETLDEILKGDAFYPNKASYEVEEYTLNLVSPKIIDFQGK